MAEHSCPYNRLLDCADAKNKCYRCGWNPKVKELRVSNAMKKRYEQNHNKED